MFIFNTKIQTLEKVCENKMLPTTKKGKHSTNIILLYLFSIQYKHLLV